MNRYILILTVIFLNSIIPLLGKSPEFIYLDSRNTPLSWLYPHYFIAMDSINNIWIASGDRLYKTDTYIWKVYYQQEIPGFNGLWSFEVDKNNRKWFDGGVETGLMIYNDTTWYIPKINYPTLYNKPNVYNHSIQFIFFDNNGESWIGGEPFLFKYDGINWVLFDSTNSGLPANETYSSMAREKNGTYWFGGSKGLHKFDGNNWYNYTPQNSGIPNSMGNEIRSIYIDEDGTKWFATVLCGLLKYDDKTWTVYDSNNTNAGRWMNAIMNITRDKKNILWLGTTGGPIFFDGIKWTSLERKTGVNFSTNFSLKVDKYNNKWFSGFHINQTCVVVYNEDGVTGINPSLGVEEEIMEGNPESMIYPNPASNTLHLKDVSSSCTIRIFTPEGIKVLEMKPLEKGGSIEIDIRGLAAGLYFVQVGNKVEKFVKLN